MKNTVKLAGVVTLCVLAISAVLTGVAYEFGKGLAVLKYLFS